MYDVITFGTATLDVFLKSSAIETNHNEICIRSGAKLEVEEIYFDTGGGGTNSAVTFARQGLKVASVIQIGNDFGGNKILETLEKEGVDTSFCARDDIYSDYSTILWTENNRTILVYRGPTRLEVSSVPWSKLLAKWFYISSLEGNIDIVSRLIKEYPQSKISWNPGGRELKQRHRIFSLLPNITQLNLNKEEMMELLGFQSENVEIKELLKKAQKLPCRYIVITDDRNGAYLWNNSSQTWLHSGIFEDSPRLEATGAGDSFGSGLVAGFIKELSLWDCLYLAAANASSVVSQVGAKKGILRVEDLRNWPKENLRIEEIKL